MVIEKNMDEFFLTSDTPVRSKKSKSHKKVDPLSDVLQRLHKNADVDEDDLNLIGHDSSDCHVLEILLCDRSKGQKEDGSCAHIVWATDNYKRRGESYYPTREIRIEDICFKKNRVIRPRALKSKEEQTKRIKQKAEVFTPSWVCNAQNNLVDDAWFGRPNVFNVSNFDPVSGVNTWKSTSGEIEFGETKGRGWLDYVTERRLEITCGEAPYLVSRYDAITGKIIPVSERIGLLDRKLRVVGEHAKTLAKWREYAYKAIRSVYAFEWQGDNLLLARENIFVTFIDYYFDFCRKMGFDEPLTSQSLAHVAFIISWNIVQMDGLTYIVPYSDQPVEVSSSSLSLLDDMNSTEHNPYPESGVLTKIAAWTGDGRQKYLDEIYFRDLVNR